MLLLRARGHTVVAGEALDPEALQDVNTVVILDPPKEPVQDAADRLDAAAARWLGDAVDAVRVIGPRAEAARVSSPSPVERRA